MQAVEMRARAKINIALDVLGRRPDGYHDLKTIMQSISLYDTLIIKRGDQPVELTCDLKSLPVDDTNLVYKAVLLFKELFSLSAPISVSLIKRIPVAAGLAGGSSDCAAALLGLRKLFGGPGLPELMELGRRLGADVPFCMTGGTMLAEGIGEKLTPLPPHPPVLILVAKPPFDVKTREVFAALDLNALRPQERPDINGAIRGLRQGDLRGITRSWGNVLETVTVQKYPVISEIKDIMVESGALGALMSGSGPAVAGYFTDRRTALAAMKALRAAFPEMREVFLTTPVRNTNGVKEVL
ncbi:MAG: 4-(cytidine 5'-diphospho)-2-C-methyl-D-erythritol kinase [Clostridiales bacterium]|jgi:4-diphosphocytidyl-2-C-methyl-D-erythritol kinase|nr:4-(cytidine 5'-diphospho)-2-C-methyl-D-erythritol kinase [Clostridiales bacterium]